MPEPKQPQDHQAKKPKKAEVDEYFTFTLDGTEYTMPNKTLDVITLGFMEDNVERNEISFMMTALREMAGDDPEGLKAIKAIRALRITEQGPLNEQLKAHLGANLGE